MNKEVRIDKWLWAVRIFKTRSIATEACKKGRIVLNGIQLKPSRSVKIGDILQVRSNAVTFSFKVLDLADKRMGAKLVPDFMENVTTPEQLELFEIQKLSRSTYRANGTGKPSKKDRREINDYLDTNQSLLDEDIDIDLS